MLMTVVGYCAEVVIGTAAVVAVGVVVLSDRRFKVVTVRRVRRL